mmetsp:Transcript_3109/g.7484  ORF Transcript_3109/g.7484 Transcript_3109/m.7484 type:complete len:260 (-) Transcript_3109:114-893(-)
MMYRYVSLCFSCVFVPCCLILCSSARGVGWSPTSETRVLTHAHAYTHIRAHEHEHEHAHAHAHTHATSHSLVQSLTRSLTRPVTRPVTHSLTRPVAHSLDIVKGDTQIVVVVTVVAHGHVDGRLVDAGVLRQLPVLLEVSCLVGRVLVDDVDLFVLKVSLGHQHDVTGGDPYLFAHLSANVSQSGDTVEAKALAPAVSEHLDDLGVLLAVLLELELALGLLSVALSPAAVLSSLSLRLRHLQSLVCCTVILLVPYYYFR